MYYSKNMTQCARGHWYDTTKAATCPQCAAESGNAQSYTNLGATEPVGTPPTSGGFGSDVGVTDPIPDFGFSDMGRAPGMQDYGKTEPAFGGRSRASSDFSGVGETMPPTDGGFSPSGGVDSYGKTEPSPTNNVRGFLPVVGWLVCIDGPDRGRDFRIHPENNFLGRSEHMDICIKGDPRISRDKHLMIVYDSQDRLFYLGAPGGTNIIRLNGKPLLDTKELNAYDVISIGSTKLMFVPFCGERYGWDD